MLGEPLERLSVEVVGHVAVVTADPERLALAIARDHRRQVHAGRPSLGALGDQLCELSSDADVRRREDLFGPCRVEGELADPQLQRVAGGPEAGEMRLLGTTRRDELGTGRDPGDRHAEHVVAGGRADLVEVVQHEHERFGARSKGGGDARCHPTEGGRPRARHLTDERRVHRRRVGQSRHHQRQQHRGIVVEAVEGHPGDRTLLDVRPLLQQGGLPVAGGGSDADHPSPARPSSRDRRLAAHRSGTHVRDRQLRGEQRVIESDVHRRRPDRSSGHLATLDRPHEATTAKSARSLRYVRYAPMRTIWRRGSRRGSGLRARGRGCRGGWRQRGVRPHHHRRRHPRQPDRSAITHAA